jgi:signal transduction histidine kinase
MSGRVICGISQSPLPLRSVGSGECGYVTISHLDPLRALGARAAATADEPDVAAPGDLERIRRRLMRLAFDVHDGPLQSLAAAGFGLNDLQERLAALPLGPEQHETVAGKLVAIVSELAETERTLRRLLTTLEDGHPEIPLAREIVDAEVERFRRRSAAEVKIEGDWVFHPDSRSQALTLEAVIRESLTNVAKHAGADSVLIRLQRSDTHCLLEIQDDGCGFDLETVEVNTIGLRSVRERVGLLGGHSEILSKAGGPTLVTAILPRWRRRRSATAYTGPAIARLLGDPR